MNYRAKQSARRDMLASMRDARAYLKYDTDYAAYQRAVDNAAYRLFTLGGMMGSW